MRIRQFIEAWPTPIGIFLSAITLFIDFAAGRELHFPLLYVIPVGITAWLGKKPLAYCLSIVLPVVRVFFESAWNIPETALIEGINAFIEAVALFLYVFLIGRQVTHTRHMKRTITHQTEDMQHLRAFTRMIGTTLQGRGVSPGLAEGVAVCQVSESYTPPGEEHIFREAVERETDRFERAVAAAIRDLNVLRERLEIERLDQDITLVDVRIAMLNDHSLAKECKRRIVDDLFQAEYAVTGAIAQMEQKLEKLNQDFMRARIADLRDIGFQILRKLGAPGTETAPRLASLPPGTVVVAQELMLSDALQMDAVNLVAIVTERTGPASHVAMLARARGIPAVSDIDKVTSLLESGDHLLVDGEAGTVTVAPTSAQAARFARRKSQAVPFVRFAGPEPMPSCSTRDGTEIQLHANIGRPDEAVIVLENRLDGVGLFRSEYLFLHVERPPDVESQAMAYTEVAKMLDPLPVVIRTMDLGGDKMPRFGDPTRVLDPHSGLRGLAYSLAEKTMFRAQVRAIISAARWGNVRMMFPMVMGAADLREAIAMVHEVHASESLDKRLLIGAMIETPAAAFDIQGILKIVDFISIGTNDLAHAILAMDRGSQGPAGALTFLHPSVLLATHQVVQAAIKKGVPVSVCGEAASDPAAACLLVGMGVRNLSIHPFLTARVRQTIRQVTLSRAHSIANDCLAASTVKDLKAILAAVLRETSQP